MLIDFAHDRIGTLRAVGRTDDQLALQLAFGRTLDRVNLQPSCVPRGAIVCVRHMRIAHAPRPEHWSAAIQDRMDTLMRDAVRPFCSAVRPDACAVLFVDEAELLACLVRDWAGGAAQAWWWRSVFGGSLSEAIVRSTFLSAPAVVPAALDCLAQAQRVTPVVRAMSEAFCEQLGAAVASTFAVRGWTATAAAVTPAHDVEGRSPAAAPRPAAVAPRITAALRRYASIDFAALSSSQRAVLGLTLLIARAPAVARSAGVVTVLRSHDLWWASAVDVPPRSVGRGHAPQSAVQLDPQHTHRSITREYAQRSGYDDPPLHPGAAASVRPAHRELAPHAGHASSSTERDVAPAEAPPDDLTLSSGVADSITRTEPIDGALAPVHVVDSEFAGIVYLVNLALHLELYGDFTQPARPGLDVPIADFLALVGEHVLGDRFVADPVWTLLADLAGREPHERPGGELGSGAQNDLPLRVEQWTSRLAQCAASVLGMEPAAALPFLCARAGRLALSPTRLDVTFDLAEHPLIIRLACLDRDPGWVPDAGRLIALHYE